MIVSVAVAAASPDAEAVSVALRLPSTSALPTRPTAKFALAWPAAMVTVAGSITSPRLEVRVTTRGWLRSPLRVTWPVAAVAPASSLAVVGRTLKVSAPPIATWASSTVVLLVSLDSKTTPATSVWAMMRRLPSPKAGRVTCAVRVTLAPAARSCPVT